MVFPFGPLERAMGVRLARWTLICGPSPPAPMPPFLPCCFPLPLWAARPPPVAFFPCFALMIRVRTKLLLVKIVLVEAAAVFSLFHAGAVFPTLVMFPAGMICISPVGVALLLVLQFGVFPWLLRVAGGASYNTPLTVACADGRLDMVRGVVPDPEAQAGEDVVRPL